MKYILLMCLILVFSAILSSGNSFDYGASIYANQNGNIFVTEDSSSGSNSDLLAVKLRSNGSLDTSFGSSGKVVLNNIAGGNSNDIGDSIYVDQKGNIFVTGNSYNGSSFDLIVVKLKGNGLLDTSFGSSGKVVLNDIAGGDILDYGDSIYVDQSGNIFVTGSSFNDSNHDLVVVKLKGNGSLDTSFGSSGKVVLNNIAGGNGDDIGYSMYVD